MKPIFKLLESKQKTHVFDGGTSRLYEINPTEYTILQVMEQESYSFEDPPDQILKCIGTEISDRSRIFEIWNKLKTANIKDRFLASKQIRFESRQTRQELENIIENHLESFCLVITHNCNFRCEYCCFGDHYPNTRNHSQVMMDKETVDNSIRFIKKHSKKSKNVHVGFYGGEVLLGFDIIKYVIEQVQKLLPDKSLTFGMTSNGSLLTRDIISFLHDNDVTLTLSLDGPATVHDRYRRKANGNLTHQEIVSNLRQIQEMYPAYFATRVQLNVVLAPPFDKIRETLEFLNYGDLLAPLHKNYSLVSEITGTTFLEQFKDLPNDSENFKKAIEDSKNYFSGGPQTGTKIKNTLFFQGKGIKLREIHRRINGITRPAKWKNGIAYHKLHGCCIPLKRKTLIDVDGSLLICESEHIAHALGSVKDGIDYGRYFELIDSYGNFANEHCKHCWAASLCRECFNTWLSRKPEMGWNEDKISKYCNGQREGFERELLEYLSFEEGTLAYTRLFGDIKSDGD